MSLPFNLAFSGISSGLQTKNASGVVPTFQDDYTTNSGWTQVGTLLDLDNIVADKVGATAVPANAEHW